MEQNSLPGKKKHKGLRIFGFILLFFLALAIAAAIFSVLWYKKQITAIEAEKCAGEPGPCRSGVGKRRSLTLRSAP